MTQFRNPHFVTFGGESITGRTPPRVMVFGASLNKQQQGETAKAYKAFCDWQMMALGEFHSKEHILTDNTRVRITSSNGLDLIQVWTSGGGKPPLDPSGYLTTPIETKYDGFTRGWDKDEDNNDISPEAHIGIKDKEEPSVPPPITLHSFYQAGAVSWKTPTGFVLTYDHDGTNRYSTNLWDTAMGAFPNLAPKTAGANVYYRGTTILTNGIGVVAAGVFEGWLIIFSTTSAYFAPAPFGSLDEALNKGDFLREISLDWQECVLDTSAVSASVRRCSAWHFKPDGTRAACAIVSADYNIPSYPWAGGDIDGPGGPGYVPPFDHSNTWYFKRALTEALPQAKRYADVSTEGEGPSLVVKLTFTDVTFVGEPLGARFVSSNAPVMFHDYISRGTWPDGGDLTYAPAANPTGAVYYTGKRLWGVDYDEEGNELVVTMHISGDGSVPTSTTYSMDMKWDLRINNVVMFEVPTVGGTTGPYECHYVSLCALDARYKAATYELLVRTADNAGDLGTGGLAIVHIFDNELVYAEPITVPTEMVLTARPQAVWVAPGSPSFPSNWGGGSFAVRTADNPGQALQCGPCWLADNSYGHGGGAVFGGCWPQVQGGSNGENAMDYIVWSNIDSYINAWDPAFSAGYYPTGPQQYVHYGKFPNQVTDALYTSWCYTFRFSISTWSEIMVLKSNVGGYTYIDAGFFDQWRHLAVGNTVLDGWRVFPFVQGLAKKDLASDHYMVGTINTYSWSMARILDSAHLNPTLSFSGGVATFTLYYPNNQVDPMHADASLFVRAPIDEDDPGAARPFVRHEAMGWMRTKIDAEQPFPPDETSFRIDPIRVI